MFVVDVVTWQQEQGSEASKIAIVVVVTDPQIVHEAVDH